jgi:hypothetical protein
LFAIAHRLGKTVAEMQDVPASEIDGWREYFAGVDGSAVAGADDWRTGLAAGGDNRRGARRVG